MEKMSPRRQQSHQSVSSDIAWPAYRSIRVTTQYPISGCRMKQYLVSVSFPSFLWPSGTELLPSRHRELGINAFGAPMRWYRSCTVRYILSIYLLSTHGMKFNVISSGAIRTTKKKGRFGLSAGAVAGHVLLTLKGGKIQVKTTYVGLNYIRRIAKDVEMEWQWDSRLFNAEFIPPQ